MRDILNIGLNLFLVGVVSLMLGCAPKYDLENYNKPAVYWNDKILKDISKTYLDDADDSFISLRSEHSRSLYIEPAMILLLKMHMNKDQYKMANYYADEYIMTYPLGDSIDYVRFLKLKAGYNSMLHRYRQQSKLDETVMAVEQFVKEYPDTIYIHLANDMHTRLKMSQHQFNLSVSELYGRIGKPKAEKFYKKKAENSSDNKDYKEAKTPWYMMLFEEGHF